MLILTKDTFESTPVGRIKGSIRLAGCEDKRSSKPVMVKDLALRADKGQVEANIRSRLQVWTQKKL